MDDTSAMVALRFIINNIEIVDTSSPRKTGRKIVLNHRHRQAEWLIHQLEAMRSDQAAQSDQGKTEDMEDASAGVFQSEDIPQIETAILTLSEVTLKMAERAGRMEQLINDINSKLETTHQEFIASRGQRGG